MAKGKIQKRYSSSLRKQIPPHRKIRSRLKALIPLLAAPKTRRKQLAKQRRIIAAFCEISHNILNGAIHLSPQHYKKWKRQKAKLRALADPRLSYKRKNHIIQKGGFLNLLLPLASTLLGGLLGSR